MSELPNWPQWKETTEILFTSRGPERWECFYPRSMWTNVHVTMTMLPSTQAWEYEFIAGDRTLKYTTLERDRELAKAHMPTFYFEACQFFPPDDQLTLDLCLDDKGDVA